MMWSTVAYFWCGEYHSSLPPEALATFTSDAYVIIKVGAAKADQLGLHWAPFPVYLPFAPDDKVNAASLIVKLDLQTQVPPKERATTLLFARDSGHGLTRGVLDAALSDDNAWQRVRSWLADNSMSEESD